MKNIGFIGLGKLGLDCAQIFAEHYPVFGYDTQSRECENVIMQDLETTITNSKWIFVAVPTPHHPDYDGSSPSHHLPPQDFGYEAVIDTLQAINRCANTSKRVVLISTVLPGTVRGILRPMLDAEHTLIYNPYLIAMGSVKWDMVNPEMVIIGTDKADSQVAKDLIDLYSPLMQNHPRYVTGTWDEAECVKIFYNTFISAKVGLVNMIQDFAMRIGNINVDVVTDALARSSMRIMGPKYMTAGLGDAGACHPRDNIALRWLAKKHDLGYDIFDTIMHAREIQAQNLARFLIGVSHDHDQLPIVIHGKAYKPDVPYCVGSYSKLVAWYIKQADVSVSFVDPLADDREDVIDQIETASVILWAHDRQITYSYSQQETATRPYSKIPKGSIIVDPWRRLDLDQLDVTIIPYGDTRI